MSYRISPPQDFFFEGKTFVSLEITTFLSHTRLLCVAATGANLNVADYDGRTPAHLAASEGRLAVLRWMCAAGADVTVRDRHGNTPLNDAVREKHTACVTLLRSIEDDTRVKIDTQ